MNKSQTWYGEKFTFCHKDMILIFMAMESGWCEWFCVPWYKQPLLVPTEILETCLKINLWIFQLCSNFICMSTVSKIPVHSNAYEHSRSADLLFCSPFLFTKGFTILFYTILVGRLFYITLGKYCPCVTLSIWGTII